MMHVELQRLARRRVFVLLLVLLLLPLAFLLQLTSLPPPLYDQHRRQQSSTARYGASRTISRGEEDVGPRGRRDDAITDGRGRDDDDDDAPSPSLIPLLDEINILIVTDVHSWVASHSPHDHDDDDGYLNADYGTVLSFFERLRRLCEHRNHDLFFVNNGDYVDGTGLSRDPPDDLVRILKAMPWDAVNVGNHELHYSETMKAASRRPGGLIEALGGRYLTSNVVWRDTGEPVGSRYRFLKGSRVTLLTFGFIYEYGYPAPACEVEKVADVVRSDWFVDVVSGKGGGSFDAVLVLAHMDVSDPLVSVILGAIRGFCGEGMRVLFVTGHTHIRGYEMLDGRSVSVEAGKYLDTIGFVSFSVDTLEAKNTAKDSSALRNTNVEAVVATSGRDEATLTTAGTVDRSNTTGVTAGDILPDAAGFRHAFLGANFDVLRDALDDETRNANLTTANGQRLSDLIRTTYSRMGLNDVIGCAPRTYLVNTTIAKLDDENSLWGLYFNEVVPTQLLEHNASKIFVQDGGGLRYDLHEGIVTVGDVIAASPINDTILLVAERVEGRALLRVFDDHPDLYFWGTGDGEVVADDGLYDVISVEFDAYMLAPALGEVLNRTVEPRTVDETKNRTQIDLWTEYITERWECPPTPTPSPTSSSSITSTAAVGAIDSHATYSEEERVQMALGVVAAVLYGVCLAVIYWIVLCFTWRIGGSRPPPGKRTWLAPRCRYKVCTKKGASSGNEEDDDLQTRCHNDDEGGGRIGQGSVKNGGRALREIT